MLQHHRRVAVTGRRDGGIGGARRLLGSGGFAAAAQDAAVEAARLAIGRLLLYQMHLGANRHRGGGRARARDDVPRSRFGLVGRGRRGAVRVALLSIRG